MRLLRSAAFAIGLAPIGCGGAAVATPKLGAPIAVVEAPSSADPDALGAAYLNHVALAVAAPWASFRNDCAQRLPGEHPLNDASLTARLAITLEPDGEVKAVEVDGKSGNDDFDAAAVEVFRDAGPYPAPPAELVSDDRQVHLRWRFARDQRAAGAATATVVKVAWSVAQLVERMVAEGDLGGAARRIAEGGGEALELVGLMDRVARAVVEAAGESGTVAGSGPAETGTCVGVAKGLDDADATVRRGCLLAVDQEAAKQEAIRRAVARLLVDRDDRVRAAAVVAAGKGAATSASLVRLAGRERSAEVKVALAAALAAIEGDAALAALRRLVGDDSVRVRAAATAALAARRDEASRALARQAAVDPEATVRAAAVVVVDDPDQLEALAKDVSVEVRAAALRLLAQGQRRAGAARAAAAAFAAAPAESPDRVAIAHGWLDGRAP